MAGSKTQKPGEPANESGNMLRLTRTERCSRQRLRRWKENHYRQRRSRKASGSPSIYEAKAQAQVIEEGSEEEQISGCNR